MSTVISVENLNKVYRLDHIDTGTLFKDLPPTRYPLLAISYQLPAIRYELSAITYEL